MANLMWGTNPTTGDLICGPIAHAFVSNLNPQTVNNTVLMVLDPDAAGGSGGGGGGGTRPTSGQIWPRGSTP